LWVELIHFSSYTVEALLDSNIFLFPVSYQPRNTTRDNIMACNKSVPYFVVRVDNDTDQGDNNDINSSVPSATALFTVPKALAVTLCAHPILCRDSYFELQIHADAPPPSATTRFLSTTFQSPMPQDVAAELARRIAIRLDNVEQFRIDNNIHDDEPIPHPAANILAL
jgi:hypothetical protein